MDRHEFLEQIATARQAWTEVVGRVPRERMTEPILDGGWSIKDMIAHVAWSEREMIGVARQRALVGSPLWELDQDARNALVYAENRDRDLDEVVADEQQIYAELLPLLEGLTDEDLLDGSRFENMLPGVPPWRIFAGNTFLHYAQHAAAIGAWLPE